MFSYSLEELQKLKGSIDILRELEQKTVEPLTPELLEALKRGFVSSVKYFNHGPNYIFEQYHAGACGCLGPRDGDPFCGCAMGRLRYEYRYDLALALIEDGDEQPWSVDEYYAESLIAMGR